MKATARRREDFIHDVETDSGHTIVVDEPTDEGGADAGPAPTRLLAAALASCTAITIEMYAGRKGWDVGDLEVEVNAERGGKGEPTRFETVIRLPSSVDPALEKQILTIAAKCPVHRILEGEVTFSDRVERT